MRKGKIVSGAGGYLHYNGYGRIVRVNDSDITFKDNDGIEITVQRSGFEFQKEEFVEK